MSMLVARMEKKNTQNLGGMQKHNQREFENNSNKEIDVSRSHLNYDLVNDGQINYREKIMGIIESQKTGTRKTRKDAVLVNEWIITSDQAFFKRMLKEDCQDFFKHTTDWFKERYGAQNIAFAQVHLDETTPHMHLGVVPMRDGKLQSKNVFNRKELFAVQNELPKYLQEKGFGIQRGMENSERVHMTDKEYKAMHEKIKQKEQNLQEIDSKALDRREEVKVLSEEYSDLEKQKKALEGNLTKVRKESEEMTGAVKKVKEIFSDVEESKVQVEKISVVEKKSLLGKTTGILEISQKDWENIKKMAIVTESLKKENSNLKSRNEQLFKSNHSFKEEKNKLYKENLELKKEKKHVNQFIEKFGLKEHFQRFKDSLQKAFKREKSHEFDIDR